MQTLPVVLIYFYLLIVIKINPMNLYILLQIVVILLPLLTEKWFTRLSILHLHSVLSPKGLIRVKNFAKGLILNKGLLKGII